MPERKSRPGRPNSFQHMLELERQYMLERLQASKPPQASNDASSPPKRESPPRSSIQARRAEFRPPTTPEVRREDASPAKRPAPLVINTVVVRPRSETAVERRRETLVMDDVPTAVATPIDKPSPKVVAFEFPPKEMEQRSICVSPSWESHGRRKKEKKMMEKKGREERKEKEREERKEKEKEDARNAESRARKRPGRLSKQPPPASSADVLNKVERTAPAEAAAGARGRQKERPASAIGLMSPMKDEVAAPRKPRSRSGSFASLIRLPFERHRSSVDHAAEPEFIGGIKLELEKHLAHEKALNEQAKADEANIHPALRNDKPSQPWSGSGSLKSPPPPARGPGDAKDANRRAYPPITRHGKATKARSLISPTAPAIPDLSKMDKWRQRVGFKATSKTDSTDTAQDPAVKDANRKGDASGQGKGGPPENDTKVEAHTDIPPSGPKSPVATEAPTTEAKRRIIKQPSHIAFAQALPPMDLNGEDKENADLSNNESIPSSSDGRSDRSNGYRTAPSTPPPEPPRRSPKRNSLLSLDGSIPSLPSPTEATHALTSSASSASSASLPGRITPEKRDNAATTSDTVSTNSLTPKASDLSNAKLAFKNASREAVRRATSSQALTPAETTPSGSPTQKSSSKNPRLAPVSSSEDSCSEEFHSPSPPSTPATSRPQSEKGLPLLSNSDEGLTLDLTMPKTPKDNGKKPTSSPDPVDDEDEIQAAADKALTSFCKGAVGRRGLQRRTNSELTGAANQGLPPVPRHQPLRLKDKGALQQTNRASAPAANQAWRPPPLSGEQSPRLAPVVVPAPAVYLEEARKLPPLPPAAPPVRALTQRLGPPASFILPGDLASPSVASEASRSSDTISRSLRHTSTLSLGQLEREPIAKVFVECCGCKFYHDLPSHLYEAMANPEGVLKPRDTLGYAGAVSMTVKCPWCKHEMSTKCCAGLAAMVYVTERLH
ncbi:hypothetical protein TOPH_08053 [Tolypocladium ophioglossoides CBS 100239]|uniref:Uncharacterized protein n=1 Tax=Tolypocladium ophioglossoides (strain CBS 100239) TaxID=1163406 RepID=A0A0L0N0J9_TOLOC|nr:hypothetical protein TOPH_08053 [Tolypocladium ophioglossoides CBS 100239]